jgi:hypothetical protein
VRLIRTILWLAAVSLLVIGLRLLLRRSKISGGHVHYKESPQTQQASPTGALAPRLQKLGSHVFPYRPKTGRRSWHMNQGLNLSYAFNPARPAALIAKRRAWQAGDGVLGRSFGTRAEYQRAHGSGE